MQFVPKILASLAVTLACASVAQAAVITFTGGTATLNDTTTHVTSGSALYNNVKKYEEAGFRIEFVSNPLTGVSAGDGYIGTYYGGTTDVIHAHWDDGCCGNLKQIRITAIDGSAFDMNYFVLTSNTMIGGGNATGAEQAFIHASADGVADSYSQMLPSENWGLTTTNQVLLGSQFDSVKAVWFDVTNGVSCFGMDSFYINEPAPTVPEPTSLALVAAALLGAGAATRRRAR